MTDAELDAELDCILKAFTPPKKEVVVHKCEFLKRDAKVCDNPGVRGGKLCSRHIRSKSYKLCAMGCGHAVSSRHDRPNCVKCQPAPDKRRLAKPSK